MIDPSLPGSFYGDGTVNWWGVLGPDLAGRIHLVTALLVTWVPVGIVFLSAVVPLGVGRLRSSFGPLVLVAVSMWGAQVLIWAALSNENHDAWHLEPGAMLLLIGLSISAIGGAWDWLRSR